MKNRSIRLLSFCVCLLLTLSIVTLGAKAASAAYPETDYDYYNVKTRNYIRVSDDAGLLTDPDALINTIEPLTAYCSAVLWSCGLRKDEQEKQVLAMMGSSIPSRTAIIVINNKESSSQLYVSKSLSDTISKETLKAINDGLQAKMSQRKYDDLALFGFSSLYKSFTGQRLVMTVPHNDSVRYENPDTGYQVVIKDDMNLLTTQEEKQLVHDMEPITRYGHIIFWSTAIYYSSPERQAKEFHNTLYKDESAGVLMINTKTRKVAFHSKGTINQYIDASYARTVTDNASGYASDGKYYLCAKNVFEEVNTVLEGGHIPEPMKYTSYAMIALMLSFVIVVGVVFGALNPLKRKKQRTKMISEGKLMTQAAKLRIVKSDVRPWVKTTAHIGLFILDVILSSIGGGGGSSGGGSSGGSSGGGSSGGGSGGSSSY